MNFGAWMSSALLLAAACSTGGGTEQPDASAVDGGDPVDCTADYRESFETTNDASADGIPEPSDLRISAGGAAVSLCGAVRPGGDVDFFRFRIENQPMDLRVTLGAEAGANARVDVWTGNGLRVGGGEHQGDGALFVGRAFPEGEYLLSITQVAPGPAADAIYRVELSEAQPPCAATAGVATYSQGADGAGSRDNDVVSIVQGPATFSLTANPSDAAELTGITLSPATAVSITGESDALAPDGDDYRDRDTYAIAGGASEIALRLSWPRPTPPMPSPDIDLDVYLFYDGELSRDITESRATATATDRDELVTVAVDPTRALWLTVGAFRGSDLADLPTDYRVDVCPETFTAPTP